MNEQAETKLSTVRPMIERARRARRSAGAAIAALVLGAVASAGASCGTGAICSAVRFKGGEAIEAIGSASRGTAISLAAWSAAPGAVAMLSVMTPSPPWYVLHHSQASARRG